MSGRARMASDVNGSYVDGGQPNDRLTDSCMWLRIERCPSQETVSIYLSLYQYMLCYVL